MSENMEKFRHLDGSEAEVNLPFIKLAFQHGNPAEVGTNGCSIEELIQTLQDHLAEFQSRDLACEENATAIYHLDVAREALALRRKRREEQGVAGERKRHQSNILNPATRLS